MLESCLCVRNELFIPPHAHQSPCTCHTPVAVTSCGHQSRTLSATLFLSFARNFLSCCLTLFLALALCSKGILLVKSHSVFHRNRLKVPNKNSHPPASGKLNLLSHLKKHPVPSTLRHSLDLFGINKEFSRACQNAKIDLSPEYICASFQNRKFYPQLSPT